jgi:uncharacterized protein (TIGR00369 family)
VLSVFGLETVDGKSVKGAERQRVTVNDHEGRLIFAGHETSLVARSNAMARIQTACEETVTVYETRPPALDLEALLGVDAGKLAIKMDMQFHELSAEYSVASIPGEGNTQSFGIMHGGAYGVLGESMGSIAANIHRHNLGIQGHAVGIEVNATHTGSGKSGFVIGVCKAVHLGRTLTTHEIAISDQNGKRLSTVRITNLIKAG